MAAMDTDTLIDRYCAAWSEPDARRREELLRPVWDEGGTYSDPLSDVVGTEALLQLIEKTHQRFREARFDRTTAIDVHNDFARFGWRLRSQGAVVIPDGMDIVTLTEDHQRLKRVMGFFLAPTAAGA
jgi:hypothetical protein